MCNFYYYEKKKDDRKNKINCIVFAQPKIQVASKYERRVDTRSYDDKKKLFEGVSKSYYLFNPLKSIQFKILKLNLKFDPRKVIIIDR